MVRIRNTAFTGFTFGQAYRSAVANVFLPMPNLPTLAYAGYLIWLAAGLLDFMSHWRADLPHTSGLNESILHWVQLGLIGAAGLLGLLLEPSLTVMLLLLSIAFIHVGVGYADTRVAFARRPIYPFEQHLHSVLDTAPWLTLAGYVGCTWATASENAWQWRLRDQAIGIDIWAALVVPALLFCGLPALLELRASWRARRAATTPG